MKDFFNYQEIDRELFKLESELRGSEERKKLNRYAALIQQATEQLTKLDKEAEDILKGHDKLLSLDKKSRDGLKEIGDAVKSAEELSELGFYSGKLDKLEFAINSLEKEISRLVRRIGDIGTEYRDLMTQGKDATIKQRQARTDYEGKGSAAKPEMDKLAAELRKLEPKLDSRLFEHYKKLRAEKKLPVFVKYGGNKGCSGCGMDLSFNEVSKLTKSGDYIECPNCRRILVLE